MRLHVSRGEHLHTVLPHERVNRREPAEELVVIVRRSAKILGLDSEFGSIEVGKVANLQILTGDPLAATTWVDKVVLEGEIAYDRSQDRRLKHLFGKDGND